MLVWWRGRKMAKLDNPEGPSKMDGDNGQHSMVEELRVRNTTLQYAFWILLKTMSIERG
jgi:hypothetical protein